MAKTPPQKSVFSLAFATFIGRLNAQRGKKKIPSPQSKKGKKTRKNGSNAE